MGQSALIFQYKNINKYKMKFLIPLLVLLASAQAEKHPGKHNHTDIEALARRLATIIFRRIQETDNIQPIPIQTYFPHPVQSYESQSFNSAAADPIQTYTAHAAVPVQTYAAEPAVQTYRAEPIQTFGAEPVRTYAAEPVQTYEAEPIQTYEVKPAIQTY